MIQEEQHQKSESEIVAILERQIGNAVAGEDSDLETNQSDALDRYYGRPMGNEVEGQSQVVSRDLLETVEWMLPSLMKPFTSGKEYIKFDPVGPDDIDRADQETKVINYVVQKQNNGFMLIHDWIKDGLLMKNGYVKCEYIDYPRVSYETYTHLTEQELIALVNDPNAEVAQHTEYVEPILMDGQQIPVPFHDVKIKYTQRDGKVCIVSIPNEEMLVSRETKGPYLNDSQFIAHRTHKTESDLIEAGYDPDFVKSIPTHSHYDTELEYTRDTHTGEDMYVDQETDESTRRVEVFDCYVRLDEDGDGISELRHIVMAGNRILEDEEVNFVPFASWSPIPMPHKHVGLSEDDLVKDIQEIRTTLIRQMLDNLYLTNHPQTEVLEGKVTLDDLIDVTPGGFTRVTEMGSIRERTVPFTAAASMPMVELMDSMRETRTGVSRHTMGLDADALAQSTKGAFEGALRQANYRLELVARLFAESGIKELYRIVHGLLSQHRDTQMIVDINGEYTPINPASWRERTDLTVMVGLGTGDSNERAAKLYTLIEKAEQHLLNKSPLFTPKNLHNMYEDLLEKGDLGRIEEYLTDPDTVPPRQPTPDPQAEALKMNFDLEKMKASQTYQVKMKELQLKENEQRLDAWKMGKELSLKDREVTVKEEEADIKAKQAAA